MSEILILIILAFLILMISKGKMFAKKEEVEGVARMVSKDIEPYGYGGNYVVMRFRVEIIDSEGNIVKVMPVEMRGKKEIHSEIVDGDIVHVKGKVKNGVIMTKEALNKTTNSKAWLK